MTNSEHLQWIHDRITNFYGESENTDYLVKLREIIAEQKELEVNFKSYIKKRNQDLSNDSSVMNTFGRDNYGE